MSAPTVDRTDTLTSELPLTLEHYRGHRLSNGDEAAAHLVDQRHKRKGGPGQDVATAYIEGRELVALCGHRWIPSRDPHNLPLCRSCAEVLYAILNPGGSDV